MEIINLKSATPASTDGLKVLVITDIKQAVKNQNRVNVFVNHEYSFSLDIAQLVDFKLKIGLELSEADLAKYKEASEFGKLYQHTLEWVLVRPRSIHETREYLIRATKKEQNRKVFSQGLPGCDDEYIEGKSTFRGHPQLQGGDGAQGKKVFSQGLPEATAEDEGANPATAGVSDPSPEKYFLPCDEIIDKLISRGYLDDHKFAEYYVENRFTKQGISKKRLKMELIKKGISNSIIEEVLNSGSRNDEEEIKKLIAKKRAHYTDNKKLMNYLARQGFSYDLIKSVLDKEDDENSWD